MKNGIFTLSLNDLFRSVITAVFVAVIMSLGTFILAQGFDLFTADWKLIGRTIANVSLITLFARLTEKLLSDRQGRVFGHIG